MVVKKDDAPPTVVFKLDLHCYCEGCAMKIEKTVRGFSGVVKVGMSANKLTVIGKVDPAKVRDDLAEKYKAKVEIVSPQLQNDAAAGNNKPDDKMREKELQGEKELSQLLKPEYDEIRQSAMRQTLTVEEMERKLVNLLHAATEIAERECAKLKRLLEEEKELVRRVILEKDDEVQLAKRQIEKIDQELVRAQKDAELARKDADAAERECAKLKRLLEEEKELVRRVILEKDDEVQLAKRQIEEIDQELVRAQKDAELARKDADAAENERTKVKREKEKEELIKHLKLETQEIRQVAVMISQEAEQAQNEAEHARKEAEHARNEAEHARNDTDIAQGCAICLTNGKDMAFGCGHMTCEECGKTLPMCPICREHITIRIKLFHG